MIFLSPTCEEVWLYIRKSCAEEFCCAVHRWNRCTVDECCVARCVTHEPKAPAVNQDRGSTCEKNLVGHVVDDAVLNVKEPNVLNEEGG